MSQSTAAQTLAGTDVPRPALSQLASMPRVNLRPPELAAASAARRLQTGCVAVVLAAAVVVGSLWFQGHNEVNNRKKDLAQATTDQTAVQRRVSALAYVSARYAAVDNATQLLSQTLSSEVRWSTQLRDLSLTIPDNVWLTTVAVTPSSGGAAGTSSSGIAAISFQGIAGKRDDVATWLESISKQKGYVGATYSTTPEQLIGTEKFVAFTSTVSVTAAAQSGRFSTSNGG